MRVVAEVSAYKRRLPENKKNRKFKKSRFFLGLIIIALCLYLLWGLVLGVRGLVLKAALRAENLYPQVVSQTISGEGLLIKQEYLVTAPLKGTLKFTIADGERVKSGSTLGVLTATSLESTSGVSEQAIKAPASGVFSRHIDGLETILLPSTLDVVELPSLDKIENEPQTMEAGPVDKGQALAKVVDNLAPIYVYAVLPESELKKMKEEEQTYLKLQWRSQALEAKVEKFIQGKQTEVLLSIKNYPDELVHQRRITFTTATGSLEGLLVDEESLVLKEGKTGLFQVWKGIVRWVPVTVEGRLKGKAAIQGPEIQPGIRYIVNPALAREGDRIK
ncbi:HlyD family efflux transporter periplasmic adaptor subunit [Desulforamulus ruminis]|uniref:RND related barrel-sandwich hybrid domain-containing protein n=1 Tax=Desulforamulus ruminis (strain ATCC 23193 / DSM 2154 / NCIMB 8452 / DL) TaxID=696281 RepID=F6DK97_DESRL|nr:HlyD family efflux transporter periplasmic adaptor subunit [Desulforamulus ruminis]AEG61514.1 hypothetical protein Desru_3309 [Desulforamulus ruminis DSM 2154]